MAAAQSGNPGDSHQPARTVAPARTPVGRPRSWRLRATLPGRRLVLLGCLLWGAGAGCPGGASAKEGPSLKQARRAFQEIHAKFEAERDLPVHERVETVQAFARAPCPETVKFLATLYEKDKPALWIPATSVLGKIRSAEAAQVFVREAVPRHVARGETLFLESLMGPWPPEAESWLLRGALTPEVRTNPELYKTVVHTIAALSHEKRYKVLGRELNVAQTPAQQLLLLESLLRAPRAGERVAARLVASTDTAVQVAAFQLLVRVGSKKHRSRFLKGLKTPHARVRAVCLDGLSALNDRSVLEHASALLKDSETVEMVVQIAAVRALLRRGGREVIEPLFQALDDAPGRVRDDITDALTRLTGEDFGPYSLQWESWWAGQQDAKRNFEAMSAGELSALIAERESSRRGQRTATYHGVRVLSDRVVFIIDTSDSMGKPYGATTSSQGARKNRAGSDHTRMAVAQGELRRLLQGLAEDFRFNVLRFDTFLVNFAASAAGKGAGELAELSPATRQQALKFIDEAKAAGMTNISRALEESFLCDEVDTVFLLTDGGPTLGVTDYEELLNIIRRWNRHRRVRINTLGFSLEEKERELLLRMADENYGVFVDL